MKGKVKGVFIFLLIFIGIVWTATVLILHIKYQRDMNTLIENRVIYRDTDSSTDEDSSTDSDSTDSLDSDINDLTIEVLTEDQKIGSIKKGTPIIRIPSLDITVPVVNGTDSYSLRLGAGKFSHSVNMGENGNFAVAGHSSTIYNCIFNDLESIKISDKIECFDARGVQYNYYVTNTFKTDPSNIDVTYSSNESVMTIVTCTDGGRNRFIVSAKLMTDKQFKKYRNNIKHKLVLKAKEIASEYTSVDVISYINKGYHVGRVPYYFKYMKVENIDPFFKNYVVSESIKLSSSDNRDVIIPQSFGLSNKEVITN